MKSILIIGMGAFGRHLALKMIELKNDVIIVDKDESIVEEMSHTVTDSQIGDCTKEEVLKALGVSNLEITALLKDLGAKLVISKASRDIQAKFLLRNGADQIVYPDKDMAEKLAIRSSLNNIIDYFEVSKEYSIFELPVLSDWVGNSIEAINVRNKYHINILIIKNGNNIMSAPKADYVFKKDETMLIFGKTEDIIKLTNNHS